MTGLTKFDEQQCHKWALLLRTRHEKTDKALTAMNAGDFKTAKRLLSEVVYGASAGKDTDPGMAGSLLYHMAMVTKMAAETRFLLQALQTDKPAINAQLWQFYDAFVSDVAELSGNMFGADLNPRSIISGSLEKDEKISLFLDLTWKTAQLLSKLENKSAVSRENVEGVFREWGARVVEMRLRQEYETIEGLLVSSELAKTYGLQRLQNVMEQVQERFGQETVDIALDVTLKVGMRREKLQSIMLSDHFINYTMDIAKLDGNMQFYNCPIAGSHQYLSEKAGVNDDVAALF